MTALRDTVWDAIVVGAGLGGLAAAAELTRRGQRVLVLEQHDVPGGYAHHFLRRPRGSDVVYEFDVALHQIGGLAPGRRLPERLKSLGLWDRVRLRRFAVAYRMRGPAHDLHVSTDPHRYEQQLGDLFPEHRAGIRSLFSALEEADLGVRGFDDPPAAAMRWLGRTLGEVLREYVADDRFLSVFSVLCTYLGLPPSEVCAFTFGQVWATFHLGGCFYFEGGGQALSNALVDIIEAGGGQVLLKSAVTRIVTAGGRAAGVETRRHGTARAPVVISNASAPHTFERLLDEPRLADADRRRAATMPPSVSIIEAYVGLRGRAEELGLTDRMVFDIPSYDTDAHWAAIHAGDYLHAPTAVANHNLSDPTHVPPGRSIVNVAMLAGGAAWNNLGDAEYAERKEAVERHLLDVLEGFIPGVRDRIEICETGTPRTMARYSWNPDGAIYGIAPAPTSHPLRRPRPRSTVPGLYLAGAWTFPVGGFHGALVSGLHTADLAAADIGLT